MPLARRVFDLICIGTLLTASWPVAFGQDKQAKSNQAGTRATSPRVRLDALGDPLPPQARFRFGTERYVSPLPILDMALSPDGKSLLTRDFEHVRCWDAATGRIRWEGDIDSQLNASYGFRAFAFSSSSEFCYSHSGPDTLYRWNLGTGRLSTITVKNGLPLLPENRPVNAFPGANRAVDVSRDGKLIVAAGGHGVVVYDQFGNSLFEIPNKPDLAVAPAQWNEDKMLQGGHYSLALFSPDGNSLAVVTSDSPNRVRVYDISNSDGAIEGARIALERCAFELESRLVRMAYAPDGSSIATTERSGAVSQFAAMTGKRDWTHTVINVPLQDNAIGNGFSTAIAYSPDGKLLAAAVPEDGQELICLFEPTHGECQHKLKGHLSRPTTVVFAPDSKTLYSAGADRIIFRWDVHQGKQKPLERGFYGSGMIATSARSGRFVFGDTQGTIHIAELVAKGEPKEIAPILPSFEAPIAALAISPDGEWVAAAHRLKDEFVVTTWSAATGELAHRWRIPDVNKPPSSKFDKLAFSADGSRLAASALASGKVYLLDPKEGKQIAVLEHTDLCGLSFDRTGLQLITAGANEVLCIWNSATGELLKAHEMIGGDLQNVCCSPADDLIITAHFPNVLRVWNSKDMTLRRRIPLSGQANFNALAFSNDGNWIASGASGVVNIINTRTAERVWQTGTHQGSVLSVGFAENDKVIVTSGSDALVYGWELVPQDSDATDYDELWIQLFNASDEELKQLQWRLVQIGDAAVDEVERRLKLVTRIINLRAISKGVDRETGASRVRLAMQLCEKNPAVEVDVRMKRAVEFLGLLHTSKSLTLLKNLSTSHPSLDVRREAMFVLEKIE